MSSRPRWLALFNPLYLLIIITSTFLLYKLLDDNINHNKALSTIDLAFISIYFLPAALICIASAIVMTFLIKNTTQDNRHRSNICTLLTMWFAMSFKDAPPSDIPCVECCGRISGDNILALIINSILIYTTIPFLSLLIPVSAIGITYAKEDFRRATGFCIQCVTIFLNVAFHLFSLRVYGIYSLIIVLCGICYALIGCVCGYYSDNYSFYRMYWVALEILAIITVLTIAFVVKYEHEDDLLYFLTMICCVNYLFPNIPFFKLMIARYCKDASQEYVYKYIVRTEDASLTDKYYYLLHVIHHKMKNNQAESDEESNLLEETNQARKDNAMQSLKSQYEYTKCKRKYKMINALHTRRSRYIFENICIYGYVFSTLLAYLFPIFWFFYVWIHLNVIAEADVIIGLNTVNAQYIFVWIICSLYCWSAIVCFIGIVGIRIGTPNPQWTQIMLKKNAILLLRSVKENNVDFKDCNEAKKLIERAGAVEIILDAETFQMDIGLIILSYLYAKGYDDLFRKEYY